MDVPFPPPEEPSSNRPSKHIRIKPREHRLPITVVFVIGPPGAGKGTICTRVSEQLGYYHLSTGDYLRDLSNRPDEFPKEAYAGLTADALSKTMSGSSLIAPEKIAEILRFKLEKEYKAGNKKFLVDGFPRTIESAWAYEKVLGKPSMVILAECPKGIAGTRFLSRGREVADTVLKFEKRYAQHMEETPAILRKYQGLYKKVDTNRDKSQAIGEVVKHLEVLEKETIVDRTRRVIADNVDWKGKVAVGVGAAFLFGGMAIRRRFWRYR